MNYKRVVVLAKHQINKLLKLHQITLLFCLELLCIFVVGWNGENVTLFKTPMHAFGNNRTEAFESIFNQLFSWSWLMIAFLYLLPQLLSPLTNSFSVNQMLWLRLTPCLPIEVATFRVIWVISWAIWLGFLEFMWILCITYIHKVSLNILLLDVAGLVSYIFFTGGLTIALSDLGLIKNSFRRTLISTFSLISPMIIFLFYLEVPNTGFNKFFPIVLPFTTNLQDRQLHITIAFLIGCFLLVIHILKNTILFREIRIQFRRQ